MPLFLLVPVVAAASTSIAAIISAAVAGASGTAVAGTGIWYFFLREKEQDKQTKAHQDSVKQQNQTTRQRVGDAKKTIALVSQDVKKSTNEVKEALASSKNSKVELHESVKSVAVVTQQLTKAAKDIATSTAGLSTSLPEAQVLAEKTQKASIAVAEKFKKLTEQVEAREGEIRDARLDIEKLTQIIDAEGRAVKKLTGTVEILTHENEGLKSSLTTQSDKYAKLEAAARHADNNHRLFRRAVQESRIPLKEKVSVATQTHF